MRYRFFICDVFTDTRFGGNQLAVLPEAAGLDTAAMQRIAREFNFSETAFVFPAERGRTCKVRIFTPAREVPFAGHPNIGTAFTLASLGRFGEIDTRAEVTFEEAAGPVPITIERRADGRLWCELAAPAAVSFGGTVEVGLLAAAVGLADADIVTDTHAPKEASVGLPFVIAELSGWEALQRARIDGPSLDRVARAGVAPDIHLYVRSDDGFDIRARMFAPLDGVPEDPATGSANCALAGLLAHHAPESDGDFGWRIAQGVEMGRPSVLEARARKRGGTVTDTWIGGNCVAVADGHLDAG